MESGYRKRVGQPNKFGGSWFSVNRRIYIHESTLFKLREIKDQNSLSSDDEVFQYLIMRHDYLCLVERIDYCSESQPSYKGNFSCTGTYSYKNSAALSLTIMM